MHIIQLCLYIIAGVLIWISSIKTETEEGDHTELLMYKGGVVTKENFVYYSLEEEGTLKLTLNSLDGDADIYIAENSKVPTYEPETYVLQSASYGEETVDVPKSLIRPLVIGIYGNSVYDQSNFELKVERVICNESDKSSYSDFVKPYPTQEEQKNSNSKTEEQKTNKPKEKVKVNNKLDIKSLIFSLLEVLASAL